MSYIHPFTYFETIFQLPVLHAENKEEENVVPVLKELSLARGNRCILTPCESCCCSMSYMSIEKKKLHFPCGEEMRERLRTEMGPIAEASKTRGLFNEEALMIFE